MNTLPVFRLVSSLLTAIDNCERSGNAEWHDKHNVRLASIVAEYLPSGSGWDNGTRLDDASTPERLVFTGSFHHMDEHGMYDGWSDHTVIVTPTLASPGFNLRVTGRDRNDIKDYLHEAFYHALTQEVTS